MTLSRERGIAPAAKISAAIDSGCPLHRGIRNMLRCDEAAVVEGIAHYVISQHWSLRLLSTTIEKGRNSPFPGFIRSSDGYGVFCQRDQASVAEVLFGLRA